MTMVNGKIGVQDDDPETELAINGDWIVRGSTRLRL
jgi:hypothetical protein